MSVWAVCLLSTACLTARADEASTVNPLRYLRGITVWELGPESVTAASDPVKTLETRDGDGVQVRYEQSRTHCNRPMEYHAIPVAEKPFH